MEHRRPSTRGLANVRLALDVANRRWLISGTSLRSMRARLVARRVASHAAMIEQLREILRMEIALYERERFAENGGWSDGC